MERKRKKHREIDIEDKIYNWFYWGIILFGFFIIILALVLIASPPKAGIPKANAQVDTGTSTSGGVLVGGGITPDVLSGITMTISPASPLNNTQDMSSVSQMWSGCTPSTERYWFYNWDSAGHLLYAPTSTTNNHRCDASPQTWGTLFGEAGVTSTVANGYHVVMVDYEASCGFPTGADLTDYETFIASGNVCGQYQTMVYDIVSATGTIDYTATMVNLLIVIASILGVDLVRRILASKE